MPIFSFLIYITISELYIVTQWKRCKFFFVYRISQIWIFYNYYYFWTSFTIVKTPQITKFVKIYTIHFTLYFQFVKCIKDLRKLNFAKNLSKDFKRKFWTFKMIVQLTLLPAQKTMFKNYIFWRHITEYNYTHMDTCILKYDLKCTVLPNFWFYKLSKLSKIYFFLLKVKCL